MIVDCGGGTVDITTYVISQIHPTLEFDELLAGVGQYYSLCWSKL